MCLMDLRFSETVFLVGMQQASINLTQSLHEVYEPDWHGKDDIVTIGKVGQKDECLLP